MIASTTILTSQDFPSGPVVEAPGFHCRGHGFDLWLGKLRSHMHMIKPKNKTILVPPQGIYITV